MFLQGPQALLRNLRGKPGFPKVLRGRYNARCLHSPVWSRTHWSQKVIQRQIELLDFVITKRGVHQNINILQIQINFCNCISWGKKKEITPFNKEEIAKTNTSTQHFQVIPCAEIISPNIKIMLNSFFFFFTVNSFLPWMYFTKYSFFLQFLKMKRHLKLQNFLKNAKLWSSQV